MRPLTSECSAGTVTSTEGAAVAWAVIPVSRTKRNGRIEWILYIGFDLLSLPDEWQSDIVIEWRVVPVT